MQNKAGQRPLAQAPRTRNKSDLQWIEQTARCSLHDGSLKQHPTKQQNVNPLGQVFIWERGGLFTKATEAAQCYD